MSSPAGWLTTWLTVVWFCPGLCHVMRCCNVALTDCVIVTMWQWYVTFCLGVLTFCTICTFYSNTLTLSLSLYSSLSFILYACPSLWINVDPCCHICGTSSLLASLTFLFQHFIFIHFGFRLWRNKKLKTKIKMKKWKKQISQRERKAICGKRDLF